MKALANYTNGNYRVIILEDGTKIRMVPKDTFHPERPECMDIKITDCCDMKCPMCHENSTPNGKHGDIMNIPFFNTLKPGTELAIGGGNPLAHPDLIPFLKMCKEHELIPSMTVNQRHFIENFELIRSLTDEKLIYGLGISLIEPSYELIYTAKQFPNAVIHVIAGYHTVEQIDMLRSNGLKVLILGYKKKERGLILYDKHPSAIDKNIEELSVYLNGIHNDPDKWFEVLSFDNLALEQLNIKGMLSEDAWEQFYMGWDGFATMYIDCVKGEYAVSSTSKERYPITNDINEMFKNIQVTKE